MRKSFTLLFLIALLATGCQRRTTDTLNVAVISTPDALTAITKADPRARAKGTARFTTRGQVEAQGKPFIVHGSGVVDFTHASTDYTIDFGTTFDGSETGPHAIRFISTKTQIFLCLPADDGTCAKWGGVDRATGEFILNSVLGGTGYVDPALSYLPLLGAQPTLDFVGTLPVTAAKVPASEFHITLDPTKAVDRAPKAQKDAVRKLFGNVGELLKASAWVGADGFVYQYSLTIGVGTQAVRSQVQFYDYGKPSAVRPPKGAKFFTSPLDLQAFFGFGGGPPQPQPEPSPSGSAQPSSSPSATPAASPTPSP